MWYLDYPKICQWCNAEFRPKNPKQKHCCIKHKQAHHRAYRKYVANQARACRNNRNAGKRRKKKSY